MDTNKLIGEYVIFSDYYLLKVDHAYKRISDTIVVIEAYDVINQGFYVINIYIDDLVHLFCDFTILCLHSYKPLVLFKGNKDYLEVLYG